ncbi:MAG: SPOR domain-containing protein [Janthinobacterium lividum]
MDVAAYIKELLHKEQFIYVPGLGTFLTRKTAGVYHPEQQRLYPPKNSIDFVAEEKQDETLENYIKVQKNISATASKYFIEKFVDELKKNAINKNIPVKEALFSAENKSGAEHKIDADFNKENFGLPVVKLSTLKTVPDFPKKEETIQQEYAGNFYREFSENDSQKHEVAPPKKNTGFWVGVFSLLLIGILGCYALYLYYPDIFTRFLQKEPAETGVQKPVDTVKQIPVTQNPVVKDAAIAKVVTDTPVVTKTVAPAVKPVAPAPKPLAKDTAVTVVATTDPDLVAKSPYEIIGASFKTLKGAKAFLNQLKEKGMHRAKILNNTSGKPMLITFGSFKDKETAQAALEKLRAKDVHSEAYIQHYK